MTYDEAIESLIHSCDEFSGIVTQLKEENAFLADTIEKHNLGKIKEERRLLLKNVEQAEARANISIAEAKKEKLEYEGKLKTVAAALADVQTKQKNTDAFIEKEANKKAQKQIKELTSKNKKLTIAAAVGILIGVAGIVINFV
jgi:hypothetical protein